MNEATQLSHLYPPSTPLADVAADFRGMPLRLWQRLKLSEQFTAYYVAIPADAPTPLSGKRIWNPRDSYGMKSI